MNQRPADSVGCARAHPGHAAASPRGRHGRAWLAALLTAACGFAQAAPTSGIERLVAQDAAAHLQSPDPETRGEAALLVAASGAPIYEERLLRLAEDPAPAARHRALVALGLLATPAAVARLDAALRTAEDRSRDDGVVAAYALGLVPAERAATTVARALSRFRQGSWRRQHDALLALLQAMATRPDRAELGALRLLREEESMRSGDLRGALLELLLPLDRSLTRRDLERVLRRGSAEERRALLRWMARRNPQHNDGWCEVLLRLAERDKDPAVRALALRCLGRSRALEGMEVAAHALRSEDDDERRAAVVAMLAIGGASVRGALEQHILRERDRRKLGALLEGFQAPPSAALVDLAAALAADERAPSAGRVAAAELLARSAPDRAAPLLRELFRTLRGSAVLARVARALARADASPTPVSRVVEPPATLAEDVPRWQALLIAGHADAQRAVLATLQDRRATENTRLAALKAWRQAVVLGPRDDAPPALLRALR